MIAVVGAGSVGLVVGARLARAGEDVLFVTRGPEAALRIESEGVRIRYPSTGESWRTRARAVTADRVGAEDVQRGPLLFCVRSAHTEAAARALARSAPAATAVSMQNDVDNEARLAQHFGRVIGVAVRQTCTRTALNEAVSLVGGRLAIGAHPEGGGEDVEQLAGRLRAAGYDVGASQRIAEDKWLKLCVNLTSAPNALIRRVDHTAPEFVEIKVRLLEEAKAALEAAGVTARSCDGRDRSLDDEIAHHRESLALGSSARHLPVYNQVWSALRHGGPVEADAYHRRILDLAAAHRQSAPVNQRVLASLERAVSEGLGPESLGAAQILAEA